MAGRIRKRLLAEKLGTFQHTPEALCPLCGRPIPDSQKDAHHLVPKSKGGHATASLHRICHRQIHAVLTETELARQYNTLDTLRAHPELNRFVRWVQNKPPDFFQRSRKSQRLRAR